MMKLREISKKDLPIINKWRNDKEIIDYLNAPLRLINIETDESWFETYQNNRQTQIRSMIESDGRVIGMVNLTNIDIINRNAELSIMIGEKENQNRGIGTKAVQLMLKHAFTDLNLHKVYLTVLVENNRAIKVYKKTGFSEEGVLRETVYKNGVYKNMLCMSILESEYRRQYTNG